MCYSRSTYMKKTIITIAGKPGSGKSTTSKKIASELNYKHFSSGDLYREIAKERQISINEINTLAESEKSIDHRVDDKLKEIGEEGKDLVIDSRMAWHWMPNSFRVYLDLDLDNAAKRIINNSDPERLLVENITEDPIEYAKLLQERLDSEIRRYYDLYKANPYDTTNYDLVVDTLKHNPDQVKSLIIEEYKKWLGK